MKFFNRFKLNIVDVPKGLGLHDPAGRVALAGLSDHPGLNFLMNRLRLQRAALESALKYNAHSDMNAVLTLQAGVKWLSWLEGQFLLAVAHPSDKEIREPNQDEYEALNDSLRMIEGVGE